MGRSGIELATPVTLGLDRANIPMVTSIDHEHTQGFSAVPSPPSRVRVAYFVPPSQHFAGIERVVHEIATGLMETHGDLLDVHVLFSTRYEDDLLKDTLYTLHTLDVDRLRNLATSLRRCVLTHKFDVLVCPQIEASVIAWLATRGLRMPVFISHVHGNPHIEESEGSLRTKVAFSLFRHLISRRISAVLAVSPSLQTFAAASIARHAPVFFAKNPVRALGGAGERTERGERFRFLNVARLSRQKGQDILLRALAIARPDLPPVTLTLVGSGPDEASLRKLSSDLGLDDLVDFAGYTTDPATHFGSADCFVLSSRWEGFGVVLVEALRFGLPLLATDCDFGPSDVITDAHIGDLVPANSPVALAGGLKRAALAGHNTRDEAIRRAVASAYDRKSASEMHFAVLQEIVAIRHSKSGRLAALTAGM